MTIATLISILQALNHKDSTIQLEDPDGVPFDLLELRITFTPDGTIRTVGIRR